MLRYIRPGTLIICDVRSVIVDRSRKRMFREVRKLLIPEPGDRRREREFVLRDMDEVMLRATIDEEEARGGVLSPAPSMDQRRLLDHGR